MSVVHYKFKNSIDYDSITFDGLSISLADLKKGILFKKRLRAEDSDLQIVNAQSGEEYSVSNTFIPKNTSLIVTRVPVAGKEKNIVSAQAKAKKWAQFRETTQAAVRSIASGV